MMKALVTGAGGFLGGAITAQLLKRGDTVRNFSRSHYPALDALGVEQLQGDLADKNAVSNAVEGCDVVFHVAARVGSWGAYEDYHRANVLGTQHIIDACRHHGVRDLVFTSSPSVVSKGEDLEGGDETQPYPEHEAHYPKTKAEAERMVMAASDAQLRTVSLRPRLVWGPKDTSLLPRILDRARKGQLVRIGKEKKLIDTVYIDDAARAHLLAADALRSNAEQVTGKTYFISSGQPIDTWEMINRILAAADLPPLSRTVPVKVAYAAGWLFETVYKTLGREDEPRLTRWVVRELSSACWFDISAARRDLGYTPEVSMDEGFVRLKAWLSTQSNV